MRSTKATIQNTSKGSLGITAIGTCMVPAVLPHKTEQVHSPDSQDHQKSRDTCRDIVGHVVDMCRPTAEVLMPFSLIANHGVERVHHLVSQHARRAKDGEPEQWGNHAIREVLSQRFEGGGAHLLSREFRCVTPHDASHLATSILQTSVEGNEYGTDFTNEGGASQTVEDDQRFKHHAQCPMPHKQQVTYQKGGDEHKDDKGKGDDGSFHFAMIALVQAVFKGRDGLAKPHDRMGQFLRVAEAEVEQPAKEQGQEKGRVNSEKRMVCFRHGL